MSSTCLLNIIKTVISACEEWNIPKNSDGKTDQRLNSMNYKTPSNPEFYAPLRTIFPRFIPIQFWFPHLEACSYVTNSQILKGLSQEVKIECLLFILRVLIRNSLMKLLPFVGYVG